jgi:hypothetical protein
MDPHFRGLYSRMEVEAQPAFNPMQIRRFYCGFL